MLEAIDLTLFAIFAEGCQKFGLRECDLPARPLSSPQRLFLMERFSPFVQQEPSSSVNNPEPLVITNLNHLLRSAGAGFHQAQDPSAGVPGMTIPRDVTCFTGHTTAIETQGESLPKISQMFLQEFSHPFADDTLWVQFLMK